MKLHNTTNILIASNIDNFSRYEGESIGISASASYSSPNPETVTSATTTTKTPAAGQEEGKFGTSKSIGFGSDSDSQTSTTYAGINTSNITITGTSVIPAEAGIQNITMDNLSDIHTTTTTDTIKENSGSLTNTFDAAAVQKELDVQTRVTQEFNENSLAIINAYVDSGQKEAKDKIKDINNQEQALNDPNNTMTDEEKKAAYNDLEAQKTELYDDIYSLEYQRIALTTISSMLTTGDIGAPALYGSLQTISTMAREESLNNSRKFAGIVDPKTGVVYSNVSEESGAFDGVKLGGTRLDLDAICGENNERCINDGNGNLIYDELGRVQWNPDPKTGAGVSLGDYMNANAPDMGGTTGGVQGIQGTMGFASLDLAYHYDANGLTDWVVDTGWAGIHDWFGGEISGLYDNQGNTQRGMSKNESTAYNVWATLAVPITAPIALTNLIPYDVFKLLQGVK
ncbi:MAG: hypothetical protein WC253_06905 [Sulfurovaceae bacterium]